MNILNKIAFQVGSTVFALVVSDGNTNDSANADKCEYALDLVSTGEINESRTFFFNSLENANLTLKDMIEVLKSQGGYEINNYVLHQAQDHKVNTYVPKSNNHSLN